MIMPSLLNNTEAISYTPTELVFGTSKDRRTTGSILIANSNFVDLVKRFVSFRWLGSTPKIQACYYQSQSIKYGFGHIKCHVLPSTLNS
jgi:hypothetical protein